MFAGLEDDSRERDAGDFPASLGSSSVIYLGASPFRQNEIAEARSPLAQWKNRRKRCSLSLSLSLSFSLLCMYIVSALRYPIHHASRMIRERRGGDAAILGRRARKLLIINLTMRHLRPRARHDVRARRT